MEPFKDTEKVKWMFLKGQTTLVDAETGYRYSMIARCPKDGDFSPLARIERAGESLSTVTFRCVSCLTDFELTQDDIYIY